MKKNSSWFGIKSAIQIIIPTLSFITNAIEIVKNDAEPKLGYVFLWFGYLTHLKDSFLMVEASIDVSTGLKASRKQGINEPLNSDEDYDEPKSVVNNLFDTTIDSSDSDEDGPLTSSETKIVTLPNDSMTTFRNLNMHLVITADLLYWFMVFPNSSKPETTLEILKYILKISNHSVDGIVMCTTYLVCNTSLRTEGSLRQRMLKELALPFVLFLTYSFGFYMPYQLLGGTDSEGNSLYDELDWNKKSTSAAILSATLPLVMTLVNTGAMIVLRSLQNGIHSQKSMKSRWRSLKNKASHCLYSITNCVFFRNTINLTELPRLEPGLSYSPNGEI